MFKTVLFPLAQSQGTRQAAEMVVAMVKQYSSHLVLLSVVEPPGEGDTNRMSSAAAVEQLLAEAKKRFAEQGIDAEVIEQEGKPAFTICDVADEKQVDLIIMGSSGAGMTTEGAAESVTNRVISLSPCPVLVVP